MTKKDDGTPSMGTLVPHGICDKCGGKIPGHNRSLGDDSSFKILDISLVQFTDEQIHEVAVRLNSTGEEIQACLEGKGPAPQNLDAAFYSITGCYPFRLVVPSD